jgi:hypothetical protein
MQFAHACIKSAQLVSDKMHNLYQVCKQVVTSLFTSCYKSVHKLSTSSLCTACCQLLQQVWNKLLTATSNKLDGIIIYQTCYNHDITSILPTCYQHKIVTICHSKNVLNRLVRSQNNLVTSLTITRLSLVVTKCSKPVDNL